MRRKALFLEYFTVGWNVLEGVIAITAGVFARSIALVGFGLDSYKVGRAIVPSLSLGERSAPSVEVTHRSGFRYFTTKEMGGVSQREHSFRGSYHVPS